MGERDENGCSNTSPVRAITIALFTGTQRRNCPVSVQGCREKQSVVLPHMARVPAMKRSAARACYSVKTSC